MTNGMKQQLAVGSWQLAVGSWQLAESLFFIESMSMMLFRVLPLLNTDNRTLQTQHYSFDFTAH